MNVYDIVTKKIIEGIEKENILPWQKPWKYSPHMNAFTKKPYRGINTLLLSYSNFKDPRWATFNQLKANNIHIKPGEKATIIVFYKQNQISEDESYPVLLYYNVFNAEQCVGFEELDFNSNKKIISAENIITNYKGPRIINQGDKAFYSPFLDTIHCPPIYNFKDSQSYYRVLFHEEVHGTGASHRLNRFRHNEFGDEEYSKEELIAEIGANFLMAEAGLNSVVENSIAYLKGWIKVLNNDKKLIVTSASKAQKAADFILGKIE